MSNENTAASSPLALIDSIGGLAAAMLEVPDLVKERRDELEQLRDLPQRAREATALNGSAMSFLSSLGLTARIAREHAMAGHVRRAAALISDISDQTLVRANRIWEQMRRRESLAATADRVHELVAESLARSRRGDEDALAGLRTALTELEALRDRLAFVYEEA